MALWKALLVDIVVAAAVVGLTFVCVQKWMQLRAERTWQLVVGTVTALEQGPGFKGRPSIYLVGDYQIDREPHRFSVVWDGCDYEDRTWVPPKGTPAVGSKVHLHADPKDHSRVALESGPRHDLTAYSVARFALVLLSLIAGAIVVWFV